MQQQEKSLINQYIYYTALAAFNFSPLKHRMDDTHLLNIPTGVPPHFHKSQNIFQRNKSATTINHWYILRKHWNISESNITERTSNIFTVLTEKRSNNLPTSVYIFITRKITL